MTFFFSSQWYLIWLVFSLLSTGFFFLLSWSFFTYQHREEIRQDLSSLGSSYWIGALGWVLLLIVEVIVFIAEQAVVPDILPDLEKAVESWRISSQLKAAQRSFSDSYHPGYTNLQRYMSVPWEECRNKDNECGCVRYTWMHKDWMRNQRFLVTL